MVPGAGLEPARGCPREILSLLRLPISPSGQGGSQTPKGVKIAARNMEDGVGIEQAYTELQSAA